MSAAQKTFRSKPEAPKSLTFSPEATRLNELTATLKDRAGV